MKDRYKDLGADLSIVSVVCMSPPPTASPNDALHPPPPQFTRLTVPPFPMSLPSRDGPSFIRFEYPQQSSSLQFSIPPNVLKAMVGPTHRHRYESSPRATRTNSRNLWDHCVVLQRHRGAIVTDLPVNVRLFPLFYYLGLPQWFPDMHPCRVRLFSAAYPERFL